MESCEAENQSVNFEALISQRNHLREQVIEDPFRFDLRQKVDTLETAGNLDSVYQAALERIHEETGFFQKLDQLGVFEALKEGISEKTQIKGKKVRWGDRSRQGKSGGAYDPVTRKIKLLDTPPSKAWVLLKIAQNGRLPEEVDELVHEAAHASQHPETLTGDVLAEVLKAATILPMTYQTTPLAEARAYRAMTAIPEQNWQTQVASKRQIVEELLNAVTDDGEKVYPNISADQAIYAIEAVDKLEALRSSPQEVGRLIS